jgi:myo-inositol-1(or 4)-monophosphatase
LPHCQDLRRLGSASIDLCLVASGVYEGYYEMNLKPWDVSAGVIILSEAGGKITNISGTNFDMFKDKYIVASNSKIHKELLDILDI